MTTKTLAEILNTANLIEWLAKQPRDEQYEYVSNSNCPIAQYLTAQGLTDVYVRSDRFHHGVPHYDDGRRKYLTLPRIWNLAANAPIPGLHTFGAMHDRLVELSQLEEEVPQ